MPFLSNHQLLCNLLNDYIITAISALLVNVLLLKNLNKCIIIKQSALNKLYYLLLANILLVVILLNIFNV